MPRQPVPELEVPLVGGGTWRLAERRPENFTLISFYRGLHCPICRTYIREFDRLVGDFAGLGVDTVAISSDVRERAEQAVADWGLENLAVGYGLDLDKAREWGLYISAGIGTSSIGIEEPERFSEPGVFAVRPDGTLYMASVNTMPFARTHFKDILGALEMILKKDYPARGEA
ncbi:MAG: peroxiredoxin-like family protein [Gammaproteobacteria bacterium]|nr:peroxiredoxin-like family protein [Gammaproteobacteria bacterium]